MKIRVLPAWGWSCNVFEGVLGRELEWVIGGGFGGKLEVLPGRQGGRDGWSRWLEADGAGVVLLADGDILHRRQ